MPSFILSLVFFRHFFCGRMIKHLFLFLFGLIAIWDDSFPLCSPPEFGPDHSRSLFTSCKHAATAQFFLGQVAEALFSQENELLLFSTWMLIHNGLGGIICHESTATWWFFSQDLLGILSSRLHKMAPKHASHDSWSLGSPADCLVRPMTQYYWQYSLLECPDRSGMLFWARNAFIQLQITRMYLAVEIVRWPLTWFGLEIILQLKLLHSHAVSCLSLSDKPKWQENS